MPKIPSAIIEAAIPVVVTSVGMTASGGTKRKPSSPRALVTFANGDQVFGPAGGGTSGPALLPDPPEPPEPSGPPTAPGRAPVTTGVGVGLGSAVGVGDGLGLGVGLGTGVGEGDGLGSGVGVASGVGAVRGSGVGVGLGVGFGVGLGVGFGVGLGVGFGVGLGVGFGLGAVILTVPAGRSFTPDPWKTMSWVPAGSSPAQRKRSLPDQSPFPRRPMVCFLPPTTTHTPTGFIGI